MGEREEKEFYIYDLPYAERKELCSILDINNAWVELGSVHMNYRFNDIERFRRANYCEKSPTDSMLQEWGQQNNTVLNLFYLLHKMGHYQAMRVIKSCVPVKYHPLMDTKKRFHSLLEGHLSNISSEGAVGGFGVTSSEQTSSSSKWTVRHGNSDHTQRRSLPKVEEGATAVISSASKYGLDNLNQAKISSGQQAASPKVPQVLLSPSPFHASQNAKPNPMPETKKILNNRFKRKSTELSCEENNPEETHPSKEDHSRYDPGQDYCRKVEEKMAKNLREEAAAARESTSSSGTVEYTSKSDMNGTVLSVPEGSANASPVPAQQSPAPNAVQHNYPVPERERRISNASDASRHSECIVPVIPYKELEEATACWNSDNLLGRGGFGTVYKGTWKNSDVAIKRMNIQGDANVESAQLQITQSLDELKLLQSFPHDNILQVYGYSADHDQPPCLVYQYMPNGSVEDRLQCRKIHGFDGGPASRTWPPLDWWHRYRIAHGTARALQYLHTVKERPLIHGDVKSANILLASNLEPKLGDFGLAREGKSQATSLQVSRVHGTKPYLPDDYIRAKKLSVKVDTYSYGIVLFELCTGLRAYDDKRKNGPKLLKDLVEETTDDESLRDHHIGSEPDGGIFSVLFRLAKDCVIHLASRRPDMEKVFNDLKNFGDFLRDNAFARHISMSETRSTVSTSPLLLQLRYDTGRSLQTPSLSPSPQPSNHPHPFILSQSPSPLPYGVGVAAHHLELHPVPQINVSPASAMTNGIMGRDLPPSYSEAVYPRAGDLRVNTNQINTILPQLSELNIGSNFQHPAANSSGSRNTQSSLGSSESGDVANTMQNVAQGTLHNGHGSNGAPTVGAASYLPTVISSSKESDAGGYIPLLTELGCHTTTTNLSSNSNMAVVPPTAKGKPSIFN